MDKEYAEWKQTADKERAEIQAAIDGLREGEGRLQNVSNARPREGVLSPNADMRAGSENAADAVYAGRPRAG